VLECGESVRWVWRCVLSAMDNANAPSCAWPRSHVLIENAKGIITGWPSRTGLRQRRAGQRLMFADEPGLRRPYRGLEHMPPHRRAAPVHARQISPVTRNEVVEFAAAAVCRPQACAPAYANRAGRHRQQQPTLHPGCERRLGIQRDLRTLKIRHPATRRTQAQPQLDHDARGHCEDHITDDENLSSWRVQRSGAPTHQPVRADCNAIAAPATAANEFHIRAEIIVSPRRCRSARADARRHYRREWRQCRPAVGWPARIATGHRSSRHDTTRSRSARTTHRRSAP
jgi:hypothetical protein